MATPGDDAGDSLADVVLDAAFVEGAVRREPSAAERAASAERVRVERDRLAAAARLDRRRRPGRRLSARSSLTVLVAGALVAWWVVRATVGGGVGWASDVLPVRQLGGGAPHPTPRAAPSPAPLRQAGAGFTPDTAYTFRATQPGTSDPVAYDPCRPIPVVLNLRTAPPGGRQLVEEALDWIGRTAGLVFEVEGTVDEAARYPRPAYQRSVYGDRWAPVLVAFTDPAEVPDLDGRAAGLAGSTSVTAGGRRVYVTGEVWLDGPDLARMMSYYAGRDQVRAVILHELGHLIGLGHVDAPTELMYHDNNGLVAFGRGDLSGMAMLRAGARCVPSL